MSEILFLTICNKRLLEHVLDKNISSKLRRNNEIIRDISGFVPKTRPELKWLRKNLNEYGKLQKFINKNVEEEFRNKITIPPTERIFFVSSAKKCKPLKYQHKMPETKKVEPTPIKVLLKENESLIHTLESFDNLKIGLEALQKYRIIQTKLKKVDSDKFELAYYNRDRILLLLGDKCLDCGTKVNLTLHHVVPKKDGGSSDINNLQCLCRMCHDRVHGILKKNGVLMRVINEARWGVEA